MRPSGTNIQPPFGGVFRSAEFQRQPPYTTPHALNVCPGIGESGAGVLGVRPGSIQAVYGDYGSKVSTLLSMRYNETTTLGYVFDHADSESIGSAWTVPSWLSTPLRDPLDHVWKQNKDTLSGMGMIYQAVPGMSVTDAVSLEILALPTADVLDATYRLYCFLDDSNPQDGDGVTIVVRIRKNGTTEHYDLSVYKSGSIVGSTTTGTVSTGLDGGDAIAIRATITSVSAASVTASVWVNHVNVYTTTSLGALAVPTAKTRFGWSAAPTQSQREPKIDYFSAQFTQSSAYKSLNRMVANVDGAVYVESGQSTLSAVSGSARLSTNTVIDGVDRLGKAFFADYNPGAGVDLECDCLVTDDGTLSSGNFKYLKFAAQGSVTFPCNISRATHMVYVRYYHNSQGVVIPAGDDNVIADVCPPAHLYEFINYPTQGTGATFILRRSTDLTTATTPGMVDYGTYAAVWIKRVPSYFSPSESNDSHVGYQRPVVAVTGEDEFGFVTPYTSVTTVGEVPVGCPLIAEFKDRIYLAGYPENFWACSRRGDPFDWYFSSDVDDAERPFYDTVADEGKIGRKITCLIGHTDDLLVFGCDSAIFRLRGDPGYGGAMNAVTVNCGILGSRAWCITDDGMLYFAAPDGIYKMPSSADAVPIPVSPQRLPSDLRYLDPNFNLVQMVYDQRERCVYVFVGAFSTYERRLAFRIDVATDAFWPMKLPDDQDPLSVLWRTTGFGRNNRALFLGGRDGVVRSFSRRATTDCRTAMDTKLVIGPLRGSPATDIDSQLDHLAVGMSEDTDQATIECYAGSSPTATVRAAIAGNPLFSDTVYGGTNVGYDPKLRGKVYCVALANSAGNPWYLTDMTIYGSRKGRIKA